MFSRRWSSLPQDASFPSDLKGLGYFINEDDEIRAIDDPERYFKFHLDRNDRINESQRFAFNAAIQDVVHARLEEEGLEKVSLPLGLDGILDELKRKVHVCMSKDLETKSRLVVIFGEPSQNLGNLALRVINGHGGINKGSMISVVKHLSKQVCTAEDDASPGILLANMGELYWWPEGKKALTLQAFTAAPRPSSVHHGHKIGYNNFVPMNESQANHIAYVLETVLPGRTKKDARVDLVGIGLGADELVLYLDNPHNWEQISYRLNTLSILGGISKAEDLKCEDFKKFLSKRARTYVTSEEPLGTPLADHTGNPNTSVFTEHGTAAVLSSSEPALIECIMIKGLETILDWPEEVAKVGIDTYQHPKVHVDFADEKEERIGWVDPGTPWDDDFRESADPNVSESALMPDGNISMEANQDMQNKPEGLTKREPGQGNDDEKYMVYSEYGDTYDARTGKNTIKVSKADIEAANNPDREKWEWNDGMSEDMDRRIREGLMRFERTGSLMDPREVERLDAHLEDIVEGIQGTY